VESPSDILIVAEVLADAIAALPDEDKIDVLNHVRRSLHNVSPFVREPVDLVLWIKADNVQANDYNPNKVARPEMKLLERSIDRDGYTQPVVTWVEEDLREVVDGFHRRRVAQESKSVRKRLGGYLPVTTVRGDRGGRGDRMASTIRHNRARGKHLVEGMSEIVVELSKRNWSDKRIAKELGMEPDEVLRLKQVSGLAEIFSDREFSEAWE